MVMVGLHRSAFHLQLAARRHAQQGVLKITPIEKSTPPEAEVLAARFYDVLPRIRITDLLFGGGAMLFTGCFTHLWTGETAADPQPGRT